MAENKYIEDLLKLDKIAIHINEHQYDDLEVFLSDYDWDLVGEIILIPSNVRGFIKEIEDAEVRLDVARFLKKYAKQYFREAAERLEYAEAEKNALTASLVRKREKSAEEYIDLFQQELTFLIDQIENKGQFTGDHFAKLKKRIELLEKQVSELKTKNADLETKVDMYEHPQGYGFGIAGELERDEFFWIMEFLVNHRVARVKYNEGMWRDMPCAYYWDKEMGLFGYFVDQVSEFLDLRDSADRIKWEPFKKAFINFDKLEKEARNAISRYKTPHGKYPDNGDLVKDAIKYAQAKAEKMAAIGRR